jgi:type II secretory pathway component PulF
LTPLSEAASTNVASLLSDVVSADLPLEPALRAAAQEAGRSERRVLTRIADDIASGVPTDEAFVRAGDALPSHLLALILAGLESGELTRVLSRYLTLTRQRAEARRPLVIALAYPAVLMCGMSLAFLFLMVFIVPGFEKILDDFGTRVSFVTSVVIGTSHFIRSFWWPMLAMIAFCGLMFGVYWYVLRRRGMRLASLPVVDLFARSTDWGRFCGLLGLLVESRQPLPQALRLTAASATTLRVRGAGLAVADDVEAGLTPWEAALPRTIPGPIRQVFRWADRPEVFAEALAGLAELYTRRARISATLIGVVLEPFVLIFTVGTIGMVIVALFLPLIQLLNDLS